MVKKEFKCQRNLNLYLFVLSVTNSRSLYCFVLTQPWMILQDVQDGEILSVLHVMQTKNLDFLRKIR
jgi:hypothetical protein